MNALQRHLESQGWIDAADILTEIKRYEDRRQPLLATWQLPWPPTCNTYFRNIVIKGQARTLISSRGRKYSIDVAKLLLGKRPAPSGMVLSLHVLCFPPDRRARDLDNLGKSLLDSLVKAGKLRDDSDVWDLRFTRACLSSPPGRVIVDVRQHVLKDEQPRAQDLIPDAAVASMVEREISRPLPLDNDYEAPVRTPEKPF